MPKITERKKLFRPRRNAKFLKKMKKKTTIKMLRVFKWWKPKFWIHSDPNSRKWTLRTKTKPECQKPSKVWKLCWILLGTIKTNFWHKLCRITKKIYRINRFGLRKKLLNIKIISESNLNFSGLVVQSKWLLERICWRLEQCNMLSVSPWSARFSRGNEILELLRAKNLRFYQFFIASWVWKGWLVRHRITYVLKN